MSSSLRLKFELGSKFAPAYVLTEVEIYGNTRLAKVRSTERDTEGNETSAHFSGPASVLVEALSDTNHGFNTDVRNAFVLLPTGQGDETKGFLIPTKWVQIILIYCESTESLARDAGLDLALQDLQNDP